MAALNLPPAQSAPVDSMGDFSPGFLSIFKQPPGALAHIDLKGLQHPETRILADLNVCLKKIII